MTRSEWIELEGLAERLNKQHILLDAMSITDKDAKSILMSLRDECLEKQQEEKAA